MKIWVIGRGYPTIYNGMRGSFEFDQAKLLARHGHDVTYISLSLTFLRKKDHRGLNHFCEEGVDVFAYSQLFFPGSVMKKLNIHFGKYEDKCWHKLFSCALKSTGLPDIIHIHYPTMICSINEVEKLRKKGVKIFVTEHWTRVITKQLKEYELERMRYYACKANAFLTVGKSLVDSINELVDVKVPMEIVPNLVSPLFKPAKNETSAFTFVAVGRMVPVKRFDVIASQFIRAFKGNDNIKLKLIGDGPEKRKLKGICKNNNQVIFTGALSADKVAKEVASSNVLICYSSLETFAVPIIEAWACGLPIITLESVPASVYCDNSRGLIIPEDNKNHLGKAMKSIMNNYDEYDKDSIAKFAEENFSDDAIYSKIVSIYESK